MLTRLEVDGFKNLVGVALDFGPLTCIAGPNSVGKSNLFDAIRFLSALADRPLIDAALAVRDESSRRGSVRNLFQRVGETYAKEMSFEAEMIVPPRARDDRGQIAEASTTFLRYKLVLAYRVDDSSLGSLEIRHESLDHINLGDALQVLHFPHSADWRRSVLKGRRTSPFISTRREQEGAERLIMLHQDNRGGGGRPLSLLAANLPRTVLSSANASESPTALVVRREMQSWRLLQLEPGALRMPDAFTAPPRLEPNGAHLAATLNHLATIAQSRPGGLSGLTSEEQVFGHIANRLAELIDDVHEVSIDRDQVRELLVLYVKDRGGTSYPAQGLSDGTLRFLALATLELSPDTQSILCLEEPENGIHPERIPSMLQLLEDIAVDVTEPVDDENPLRQVMINTHSPVVVAQVSDESLLMAEAREMVRDGERFNRVVFGGLPDTWRQASGEKYTISRGKLIAYLNPIVPNSQSLELSRGPCLLRE